MLGHVATSVGNALPGAVGLNGMIAQYLGEFDVLAPADTAFAFVELLAPGSYVGQNTSYASAGGAGNDIITPSVEGVRFHVNANGLRGGQTSQNVFIFRDTNTFLTARYQAQSDGADQTGPTGKYPGGSAVGGVPGRGGGRLAGPFSTTGSGSQSDNPGAGRRGINALALAGGVGFACITFFRSNEAALAYANMVYGGNWQP